jgi:hypothetical protein
MWGITRLTDPKAMSLKASRPWFGGRAGSSIEISLLSVNAFSVAAIGEYVELQSPERMTKARRENDNNWFIEIASYERGESRR